MEKTEVVRNDRRHKIGVVVSDKMNKTIVVLVERQVPHKLYKKVVTKSTRFLVHDENEECGIGDTVEIAETRHYSKNKYFRVVRIIKKAE